MTVARRTRLAVLSAAPLLVLAAACSSDGGDDTADQGLPTPNTQVTGQSPAADGSCPKKAPVKAVPSDIPGGVAYLPPDTPGYDEASPKACFSNQDAAAAAGFKKTTPTAEQSAKSSPAGKKG